MAPNEVASQLLVAPDPEELGEAAAVSQVVQTHPFLFLVELLHTKTEKHWQQLKRLLGAHSKWSIGQW